MLLCRKLKEEPYLFRKIDKEILKQQMKEAAKDPLFIEDLKETMKAFKNTDQDTAHSLEQ